MRSSAIGRQTIARSAGIVHFAASFGLTLTILLALWFDYRSMTERLFTIFGWTYAATATIAFIAFFASVYRIPRDEIRIRFRTFAWIIAAQASFTIQAIVIYGILLAKGIVR